MSKTCGDCRWLGLMKHEILTICKNKDSNWYVRKQDEAACKHFEKMEEAYEVRRTNDDNPDPAGDPLCSDHT